MVYKTTNFFKLWIVSSVCPLIHCIPLVLVIFGTKMMNLKKRKSKVGLENETTFDYKMHTSLCAARDLTRAEILSSDTGQKGILLHVDYVMNCIKLIITFLM